MDLLCKVNLCHLQQAVLSHPPSSWASHPQAAGHPKHAVPFTPAPISWGWGADISSPAWTVCAKAISLLCLCPAPDGGESIKRQKDQLYPKIVSQGLQFSLCCLWPPHLPAPFPPREMSDHSPRGHCSTASRTSLCPWVHKCCSGQQGTKLCWAVTLFLFPKRSWNGIWDRLNGNLTSWVKGSVEQWRAWR